MKTQKQHPSAAPGQPLRRNRAITDDAQGFLAPCFGYLSVDPFFSRIKVTVHTVQMYLTYPRGQPCLISTNLLFDLRGFRHPQKALADRDRRPDSPDYTCLRRLPQTPRRKRRLKRRLPRRRAHLTSRYGRCTPSESSSRSCGRMRGSGLWAGSILRQMTTSYGLLW
jgi:hypothetical protein